MKKKLLILFIFLSFITRTIVEPGGHVIFSRLTPSDIFGFFALVLSIGSIISGLNLAFKFTKVYVASFFLILTFIFPLVFSLHIQSTIVETLIIFFLILISVCIFYEFKDALVKVIIPLLSIALIVSSLLGVYDLAASASGLPRIFPPRANGEALSGFRNAGQAGAYYLVILSILIPAKNSSIYSLLSARDKKILKVANVFALIFIFLTGKIAAYIGFLAGYLFYLIYKRNFKVIFNSVIMGLILVFVWTNLEVIAPTVHNRISMKYKTRIDDRIQGTKEEGFIQRNLGNAMKAFEDRPLIGSGLGAFSKSYDSHEVHSTYFKMIGETGFSGVFGYMMFVLSIFGCFKYRKYKRHNPYSDFLATIFPFLLGCFISWGYTYHLRKREFWILIAIIVITIYNVIKFEKQKRKNLVKPT